MQPGPGLLGTFKCLFGPIEVCESCQLKGFVFERLDPKSRASF